MANEKSKIYYELTCFYGIQIKLQIIPYVANVFIFMAENSIF